MNALINREMTVTEVAVLSKYGLTLTDDDLADFLGMKKSSIYVLASDEKLPVKPQVVHIAGGTRGKRLYDFRDVAKFWDQQCQKEAA